MFNPIHKTTIIVTLYTLLIAVTSVHDVNAQHGRLLMQSIDSEALKNNLIGDSSVRPFWVYLPPSYETSDRRYPVIYVLHGFNGNAQSLTQRVKAAMDAMLFNRQIEEMIAVFVDGSNRFGGSQYLSSPTIGDYETYVVSELVGRVDTLFRTIPDRNSRGITGFSMGAYGSMHLALKYPEVFSVVVAQSGTYDFGDEWVQLFAKTAGPFLALIDVFKVSEERAWREFNKLPLPIRNGIAYLAAVASNPDKPPFYLDLPYEVVSILPPRFRPVESVQQRIIENDIIHELDRASNRPTKLNAIKIVHGNQDEKAFIRQAEALVASMTDRGIAHEYEPHNLGHTFIAEKSLQFISDHLVPHPPAPWDVNNDGVVDILDLVLVSGSFGEEITTPAGENPDVNGDGIVDILDLVLVASHFGEEI